MTLYNTISTATSNHNQRFHYPAAIPPDPLERYGSAHLDQDIFGVHVSRLSPKQQLEFVRNILLITASQLLLTCCMVIFISQICPLYDWLEESTWVWWIPLVPIFTLGVIFIWQLYTQYFQLSHANQIVLLSLFTVCISIAVSSIVAKLFYVEGLSIIIMTLFGLLGLILYTTCQHRYLFSGILPFVIGLGGVSIGSLFNRYFVFEMDPIEILFPLSLASFILTYLVLEMFFYFKEMMKEDYILANILFFIDILYPVRFIHHFCELTDNLDIFHQDHNFV